MKYCAVVFLCSLLLSLAAGYVALPILKKLHVSQTINELGPQTHMGKQGIPTMGGISFLCAGLLCGLAFGFRYKNTNGQLMLYCAACTLCFALIGFLDDYLKVVKGRSVGLTVKQKFAPQILFALVFSLIAYSSKSINTAFAMPFTDTHLDIGVFFIPVMTFIMVAVDNSANILDGLDGLLSGNGSIALFLYAIYMYYEGSKTGNGSLMNTGIFCLCMSAALFAFLKLNAHPARVFMGDVGSLGIGGALAGAAAVSGTSLMLPFMLVTMLISSLSDILQVLYMRRHKGRKLLRMSPLHHHLELGGMPENHVFTLYNIITLVGCAAAFILFA